METQEQSVQERIADKIFGPETDEEPEEEVSELPEDDDEEDEPVEASDDSEEEEPEVEAAEEDPEFVEIELDGEILQVPEKYKDYFLRQQDYTKKTQEVAAQRKQVEVALGQLEQQTQNFKFAESIWDDTIQVHQLNTQAEQLHQYLRDNISELGSSDIEKIRFQIDETRGEANKLATKAQQATEFAMNLGFSEAEVNSVLDPRYVEVLYKASQYENLQKGKAAAVSKVKEAPTIKPKSRNPMPDDVKRKLNLRKKLKSGRSDKDKADLIREDIADRLGL